MNEQHTYHTGRIKRRVSTAESIESLPLSFVINMIIEAAAALILLFGIIYLVRFLLVFHDRFEDIQFKFFLAALVFLAAGWGTRVFLRLRSLFRGYRTAIHTRAAHARHETGEHTIS